MHQNKDITKFQIVYFGWIYRISDINFTRNGIAYKTMRCCSYQNQWWNFIIFETTTDINDLEVGDWIKLTGFLKIDLNINKTYTQILHFEKLNRNHGIPEIPDIEKEELEILSNEKY